MPIIKSKFFRNFLPFGVLVIGAYVGLAQFREANYKFAKNEPIVFLEQLKKAGISQDNYQSLMTDSLESEYEKIKEKIDIGNWINIPGPQPGEDSRKKQQDFRIKASSRD